MKRTYWKLFALLLAICMMVSCTPEVPEKPIDDTQPPIEQPAQPTEFSLTKDFVIVRPDIKQAQEVEALQLLGRGLQSASGIRFSKGTDYDENEYEILVGSTSREASQAALEGLSYKKYEENFIVTVGARYGFGLGGHYGGLSGRSGHGNAGQHE